MNTTSTTSSTPFVPAADRTPSVVMGQMNYAIVLFRLVATELYKLRRGKLSKALVAIAGGGILLLFLAFGMKMWINQNAPLTDFALPLCSQISHAQACVQHPQTQAQMAQAKHELTNFYAEILTLPNALDIVFSLSVMVGLLAIPIIVLAGTISGSEYSTGIIRLLFTRGPSRTQFFIAKVLTIIFCALAGFLLVNLFGILAGYALHPTSGLALDFHFLTITWLGHALLYLLIGSLGWLTYAMIAHLFATLGRSTLAGIVGALIWLFMEPVLTTTLRSNISPTDSNPVAKFFRVLPDYFIGNNVMALFLRQANALKLDVNGLGLKISDTTPSNQHALIVLLIYFIVCVGISWGLTLKRDITH